MQFKPDKIYINEDVLHTAVARRVLEHFSKVDKTIVSENDRPVGLTSKGLTISQGKKTLHLKRFKGDPFKLCPGFSDDVLCCNYYVINVVENCPLDCTYCILQAFINKPAITIHANIEEMVQQTLTAIQNEPSRIFRVGTGEHGDSFALDTILDINSYLVEQFSKVPNAILELKTKTDNIDALLDLEHGGRTVVAWSLNPPEIIKKQELKTVSLEDRLGAARKLVENGYQVAFHFDPIIYYPGWENGYRHTVDMMLDAVPGDSIAWISLGTLRFIPALKKIAEERFSNLSIFHNEFTPAHDGKMRYLKPIRKELLSSISQWIRKKSPSIPLYLCMEKRSVWGDVMGSCPANPRELEAYLSEGF